MENNDMISRSSINRPEKRLSKTGANFFNFNNDIVSRY
jgi:hypothetical protein